MDEKSNVPGATAPPSAPRDCKASLSHTISPGSIGSGIQDLAVLPADSTGL